MENEYPLDFDQLAKGQLLEIGLLEKVFGLAWSTDARWSFLLMGLQSQIHSKTEMSCRIDKDALRILTDAEASAHNFLLVGRHARGITRRVEKLLQVDRGALESDTSADHDRRIRVAGLYAAAVFGVRRDVIGIPAAKLPKRL